MNKKQTNSYTRKKKNQSSFISIEYTHKKEKKKGQEPKITAGDNHSGIIICYKAF